VTLAACLRRAGVSAGIPAALAEFAARRQERTAGMLIAARTNFAMFNEPDPVQMRARDGRLRGMTRLDPVGETTFGWLYGHDAIGAAEQPIGPASVDVAAPRERPEAVRAFGRWRDAVSVEDRSRMWVGEREAYERLLPPSGAAERTCAGGVAAVRVGAGEGPVVLHLHGGGYTMGSAAGAVELAERIASAVGGWVLVPDYRLAPEHPYPAALEDALAAYRWLVREQPNVPVLLSGECAGGGLAIALALSARDAGDPMPRAIWVVSPFCDLTVSSPSANAVPGRDPWLGRDRLRTLAASYIHARDAAEPLISPARADLRDLPPLLVHVAEGEALHDDAVMLADAARAAGVEVRLEIVPDSVHSFVLFPFLPEAGGALRALAEHVGAA
jgi:salicylate hydroxylase